MSPPFACTLTPRVSWTVSHLRSNGGTAGATFNGVLGALALGTTTTTELSSQVSCNYAVTAPFRANETEPTTLNAPPTPLPQSLFAQESTSTTIELGGFDEDGQWIDTIVTALPAHGTLEVLLTAVEPLAAGEPTIASVTSITAADLPFSARSVYANYVFRFTPAANNLQQASISYKLVDSMGLESSVVSTTVSILEIDNVPTSTSRSYDIQEDASSLEISLGGVDVDSTHKTIVIDKLPVHGTLYMDADLSQPILSAFSQFAAPEEPSQQ